MAAPTHHKRQEICITRLPYREGRKEKAVKVFTVSQESKYILIQGVPAVGASEELVKLCALYGAVEEYRPLDDYPAEQFTEVYLIKYQKIQSARFAKRKLDDWSFFGGVLHVCYAPEFESVQETREKLQERRRTIAFKLKQHATERVPVPKVSNPFQENISSEARSSDVLRIECHGTTDNRVEEKHPEAQDAVIRQEHQVSENHADPQNTEVETFHLPLPPQPDFSRLRQYPQHSLPEFARVPTAHATLPPNYDGRLSQPPSSEVNVTSNTSDVSVSTDSAVKSPSHQNKSSKTNTESLKPKDFGGKLKKGDKMIIRQFKKDDYATPRFIPRQTIKSVKSKPIHEDPLNKEIKKNAFTLRENQGPQNKPDDESELVTDPHTEKSVKSTVEDIRKRVAKFSSDPNVPQKKKMKLKTS